MLQTNICIRLSIIWVSVRIVNTAVLSKHHIILNQACVPRVHMRRVRTFEIDLNSCKYNVRPNLTNPLIVTYTEGSVQQFVKHVNKLAQDKERQDKVIKVIWVFKLT